MSVFSEKHFSQVDRAGMLLSDQIVTKNVRFRKSSVGYVTDWHVSSDPTLIVVQSGVLRITLQNGEYKDFAQGDMFIASDALPSGVEFESKKHGHKAEVLGTNSFSAIHIKLGQL